MLVCKSQFVAGIVSGKFKSVSSGTFLHVSGFQVWQEITKETSFELLLSLLVVTFKRGERGMSLKDNEQQGSSIIASIVATT